MALSWSEGITDTVTHIRGIHIREIRGFLDAHNFISGGNAAPVHPIATPTSSGGGSPGFMSAAQAQTLLQLTAAGSGTVTSVSAVAPMQTSAPSGAITLSIAAATNSVNGYFSSANFAKLGTIAVSATANSTDAQLRDRSTHTNNMSADYLNDGTNNHLLTTARVNKLDSLINLPVSGITMWYGVVSVGTNFTASGSGINVMANWALCNGNNGTPDLRDRFPIGAGNKSLGATGGEAAHTLLINEMPTHEHDLKVYFDYLQHDNNDQGDRGPSSTGTRLMTGAVMSAGGGQPHNNLPPYMSLWFIMRVA
jgi:hypothetical protein